MNQDNCCPKKATDHFDNPFQVFSIYYRGRTNFITPIIVDAGWFENGLVWELSKGKGIIDQNKMIYGVTVLRITETGRILPCHEMSTSFNSITEARRYIESLKFVKNTEKQKGD